ncbi:Methyl-accepting chemotaxis protein signailing domain-containing protein, HAMP domain-containing [Desulfonema limicola]|uniref:Methyl-accepting chemotaxis protein signailing domain-containing protein, HAMP domain-containing n=1 Tax=Desulfonema limicola TaxID=45656 RepID=A0A975B996_9BACT|nr:methyl-accepting chemotaxis protein [Desulfonema limicola]QTA81187.1 Methyl-accepting chemotaxis protein signailing domain-containing protein, HAMP domain-containing [Desulfonema limicola]
MDNFKKEYFRWGIRWKLISTVMALMTCFLLILTWTQISFHKMVMEKELSKRIDLMKKNLIAEGENITAQLTQQVERDLASYNFSGLSEVLKQSAASDANLIYIILTDTSNTVFVHTLNPELVRTQLSGKRDKEAVNKKGMNISEFKDNGISYIEISSLVQISTSPWGVLRLFFSLENLDKEIMNSVRQIEQERNLMIKKTILTSFFFLAAAFIVVLIFSSKILKPLIHLTHSIREISKGDLTQNIILKSGKKDEIGELLLDVKNMVDRLNEMINGISESAVKIDVFSGEIITAVDDQAIIAAQQSSSVSEISSTMTELSSSSIHIADHSGTVASLADHALKNTKEGAESVENIMVKMNEISKDNKKNIEQIEELGKKSEDIAKIMEIINAISDQTKLISFNAALEASSAGEAGKRFGVVAAEIRRLAGSVTESTGDIENKVREIREAVNQIIVNSEKGSKRIQAGLEYSDKTGAKLRDIVEKVRLATDAAKQISLSIQQQKTANEQVVLSLREIDKGADQTLKAIRNISSISKDMKTLSDNLQEMLKRFKLNKSE